MSYRKKILKKSVELIGRIPLDNAYYCIKKGLNSINMYYIAGLCDITRLNSGIVSDGKISKYKKVLNITKGYYDYDYFNICFLNNVISLCVKAVCEGYIPRVNILNSGGKNIWEMFFVQPLSYLSIDKKKIECFDKRILESFPAWSDSYDKQMILQYGAKYKKFAVFNEETAHYINEEANSLLAGRKVLGVLCRGTDYTNLKPKGHPIQPDSCLMLSKVKEVFNQGDYEFVYLATEDSFYDELFRKEFGEKLLINKRSYYDGIYNEKGLQLIKDVHFNRKNDDYLKGLEYISSLQILSKCDALVAGNCGGAQAALFWNNGQYKKTYIFDLGLY